ncbi:MAG: phosphodiester glycosidase family protein [Candidatus Marinimicrobia bacterium]|nr:phosphodiester glycosidase family protein [Candidatus Neomarinimicrobiota bacterium]MCF7903467.1 phosphodiester glycosidase family protein [Candidatus Neomarinimicrobiota bacterium]
MRRPLCLLLIGLFTSVAAQQLVEKQYPAAGLELLHYTDTTPWSIYVLKIDLQSPGLKLKAAKANQHLFSLATTSAIAEFNHDRKKPVLAAINADYFHSSGVPTGGMASDGVVIKAPIPHSAFGMTTSGKPFIDIIELDSRIAVKNGSVKIDAFNIPRGENQAIVYNRFYGRSTRTNSWGNEYLLRYVDWPKSLNDTLRMVVQAAQYGVGDMPISDDGMILSAHGAAAADFSKAVSLLDTIRYITQVQPIREKIAFFITGLPRIVRDGRVSVEADEGPNRHVEPRHPRSAVGYDASGRTIYFIVVDGRQTGYSVGMSLAELAEFMVKIGVHQGLNLDGGGSTALVVNREIVNRPSDTTGERAVSNALLVIRE